MGGWIRRRPVSCAEGGSWLSRRRQDHPGRRAPRPGRHGLRPRRPPRRARRQRDHRRGEGGERRPARTLHVARRQLGQAERRARHRKRRFRQGFRGCRGGRCPLRLAAEAGPGAGRPGTQVQGVSDRRLETRRGTHAANVSRLRRHGPLRLPEDEADPGGRLEGARKVFSERPQAPEHRPRRLPDGDRDAGLRQARAPGDGEEVGS